MPKYLVEIPEVWIQTVLIEADDEDEARSRVIDGEGDFEWNGASSLEYDHTIEHEDREWIVKETSHEG